MRSLRFTEVELNGHDSPQLKRTSGCSVHSWLCSHHDTPFTCTPKTLVLLEFIPCSQTNSDILAQMLA